MAWNPKSHVDRLKDGIRLGIDLHDGAAPRVRHPHATGGDRYANRCVAHEDGRLGPAGSLIDARDAPVDSVGDPDRSEPHRHAGRTVPDRRR